LLRARDFDKVTEQLMNRQSSAVMTDEQPARDLSQGEDDSIGAAPRHAAEAKRLEARRRFLLGGTTVGSMLVTVSRAKAFTFSECAQNAEAAGFKDATEFLAKHPFGIDGSDPAGPLCETFFRK
jgi:hypothetical protein